MSTTHILDLGGLLLKTYHGSEDQSVSAADKSVSCWQAALIDFLDKHLLPILQTGAAPRQIIAVLDKGNTYRRNLWQDYKQARREKARDEAVEVAVGASAGLVVASPLLTGLVSWDQGTSAAMAWALASVVAAVLSLVGVILLDPMGRAPRVSQAMRQAVVSTA